MNTMPIASIAFGRLGPRTETTTMASRMLGKARMTSIKRMSTESGQRPKNPATSPMRAPAEVAIATAASRLEKKALRKSSLRLRVSTSREATASCCTCASATSVPHPRVQDRVEYVHEQVDQHEEQCPVEDHALYRSVVAAAHGLV